MYKMIVIDIDDTLLTDEGTITKATIEHIHAAISRNVIVTLATGRMFVSTKQLADQIGLDLPVICYQGALIKDLKSGRVIFERTLPSKVIHRLIRYCAERDYHLQLYSNDDLYVQNENEKVRIYSQMHNVPFKLESNFIRFTNEPVTKMVIYEEPDVIEEILQELVGGDCYITKSKPFFLEVMNQHVNKGVAVEQLCNHFGIGVHEVIAIGDSWNDIKLLESVGLPVAMGNANDELKKIARYITDSNNDEGVSKVIQKFILS